MCVWSGEDDPRGSASLRFDAAEQGQPNLGHIVPNNVLQGALLRRFVALGGRLIEDSIQGLEFAASQVQVRGARSLHDAQLVVGADGAQSAVRQLAGIAVEQGRYGQTALVANLRPAQSHEGTAWQRFLDHGTLALLPLASGEVSIVWSLPQATAQQRSQLSPAEFAAAVTQDSAAVLGDLALTTPVARFPLRRVAAAQYVRDRIVLAGDAAHVVHPLAGQGVNLGLLDAASLADTLREARQQGEDPGASRVLRNYERWRKSENGLMALAMDGFNRFLAESGDRWSQLARRGMRAVGDNAALRGWFADRALGMSGDLPRAARRPGPRE
jgi:2-octaprenylphenol hydroxylase